jgi:pre-rRNA-processing protein TSR4
MSSQSNNTIAFGTDFFSNQALPSEAPKEEVQDEEDEVSDLANTLHDVSLDLSEWESVPSHPPLYLATTEEELSSTGTKSAPKDATAASGDGSDAFGPEIYENSLDTDPVFERFSKRVSSEGEQCVR